MGRPILGPPPIYRSSTCVFFGTKGEFERKLRAERAGFDHLIDGLKLSVEGSWKEEGTKVKALVRRGLSIKHEEEEAKPVGEVT